MPYVMVPVPEDRVEDVMRYVVRLMTQASMADWDEGSMERLFKEIDEPSRALLSTVAAATRGDESLTMEETAARTELSRREAARLVRELNDAARDESRPALIARRSTTETLPNGRSHDTHLLQMSDEVAELVRAADRAHLLSEEHPLGPSHAR